MPPFSNDRVQKLHAEARQAIDDGEQLFFVQLDTTAGMLGKMRQNPGGSVPEVGAIVAAVEASGWTLAEMSGAATDMGRFLQLLFRRALR